MQILSATESQILSELLIEDVSFVIHNLIARNPRISEAAIVGAITRSLPSIIDFLQIQKECISSIHWFVHNGDITNSGNRHYAMLPTYSILQKYKADEFTIKICGNRCNDRMVEREMKGINCEMRTTRLGWTWDALEEHRSKNIGFRRTVLVPAYKYDSAKSILNELRIPVITPNDFREKLPSIRNVYIPSLSGFSIRPPSWGSWYKYDSTILNHHRWKSIERISPHDQGLYRWTPTKDFRGELNSRYFYHNQYEHVAELTPSAARLWMYYLDSRENNARDVWVCGNSVFVPLEIPEPHQHWLQLVSEDWHKDKVFRKYILIENSRDVAEAIEKTLGLKIRSGQPTEN